MRFNNGSTVLVLNRIKSLIQLLFTVLNHLSIIISLFVYFSAKPYFGDLWHKNDMQSHTVQLDSSSTKSSAVEKNMDSKPDQGKREVPYLSIKGTFILSPAVALVLGITCGLVAFITPCVFPLVPLTVAFFARRSGNRRRGRIKGLVYSFSTFFIFSLVSVPFLLFGDVDPEAYNHALSKLWINIAFFTITIAFAISFMGHFELRLPTKLILSAEQRSGMNSLQGIFFMALTFALVSFSCTAPIVSLLIIYILPFGVTVLTSSLLGFAAGITAPFCFFTLFPSLLNALPRSGVWIRTVKMIFAAIMFLFSFKFLYDLWSDF